ncbi:unnamed protein product [Linum trigynum]|uniref:Uncharacterized protein n=1 Tax=Linum trigynum TaxID=586398 RepID=A0AAV2E7U9_9ROSI
MENASPFDSGKRTIVASLNRSESDNQDDGKRSKKETAAAEASATATGKNSNAWRFSEPKPKRKVHKSMKGREIQMVLLQTSYIHRTSTLDLHRSN